MVASANALLAMVNADRDRIAGLGRAAGSALAVHQSLQRLGLVAELTNRQRGRVFSYRSYVDELATGLEREI